MAPHYGAWPALITPATPEGGVNTEVLQALAEHLVTKGAGGLYLCGATGEGVFQSVEERKRVVESTLDQVAGRVPVIVHVGCVATRDAIALARHAREAGAVGVSSLLPLMGRELESTYLHYGEIAAAVPDLPFYPYLYGGQADAVTLMRELHDRIPNIGGCKYTGPNMMELRSLVEMGDSTGEGWTIFSGMDEQCLFAAMFGAPANIGSTLNAMPGVYREMRASFERGDLTQARDLQLRANGVTRILISYGLPGALREAMRLRGFDCGAPRLPIPSLPIEQRASLQSALEEAGFAALAEM